MFGITVNLSLKQNITVAYYDILLHSEFLFDLNLNKKNKTTLKKVDSSVSHIKIYIAIVNEIHVTLA